MSEHEDLRPLGEIETPRDLHILPRAEVERRAGRAQYWLDVAKDVRDQRDEVAQDLEDALNALRAYQYWFAQVGNMNDPNLELVRRLCLKYNMPAPYDSNAGRVYADGKDITEHPDSIDVDEVTTVELVQTEDGQLHFLLKEAESLNDEVVDGEVVEDPDDN